jgi:hypothetical protein
MYSPDDVAGQVFHAFFVARPDGRSAKDVKPAVLPTHHVFTSTALMIFAATGGALYY